MKTILISTLISFISFIINAQDLIIVGKLEPSSVKGKIISCNSDNLKFVKSGSTDTINFSSRSINKIGLGAVDEIYLNHLKQEFVPGSIKSVGIDYMRYRDVKTGLIININKNRVFACQFDDTCASEKFEEYFSAYSQKVIDKFSSKGITIINKNGTTVGIKNLQFQDSLILFSLANSEHEISSFIKRCNADTIYFGSESLTPAIKHGQDFILTRIGNIYEDCTVTRITGNDVFFTSANDAVLHENCAPKSKICTLLFYNFERDIKKANKK